MDGDCVILIFQTVQQQHIDTLYTPHSIQLIGIIRRFFFLSQYINIELLHPITILLSTVSSGQSTTELVERLERHQLLKFIIIISTKTLSFSLHQSYSIIHTFLFPCVHKKINHFLQHNYTLTQLTYHSNNTIHLKEDKTPLTERGRGCEKGLLLPSKPSYVTCQLTNTSYRELRYGPHNHSFTNTIK